MRGKEPFRSLLEEARAGERVQTRVPAPSPPKPQAAPVPLAERLDRLDLAGGTPARGSVMPRLDGAGLDRPLADDPLASALDDLFDVADVVGEQTRRLPAGATVAAALQDSIAELEATVEIPAQRRLPAREKPLTSDIRHITVPAMPVARPRPMRAAPAPVPSVPAPVLLRPTPVRDLPRPPPLPAGKPKERPTLVATQAPPPMLSEVAPEPRVLQVLGEENTIPGLEPTTRSSSSGKAARTSDRYRLQLEFEDTPARPLPRVAYVPPPPLPPAGKRPPKTGGVPHKSAEVLADLHELEAIDDLRAMAKALGLDGVGEVSIPSLEGLPVADVGVGTLALPLLPELHELGVHDDTDVRASAPRSSASAMRAALEREAMADSAATIVGQSAACELTSNDELPRPALACAKAVTPVIVKIPSRPKVSLESRERARRYYLDAVDLLGKGERAAAVQHLHMAIEHDDAIPLYRDLLEHLEGTVAPPAPASTPALTVLGRDGKRSHARDHWRSARPR